MAMFYDAIFIMSGGGGLFVINSIRGHPSCVPRGTQGSIPANNYQDHITIHAPFYCFCLLSENPREFGANSMTNQIRKWRNAEIFAGRVILGLFMSYENCIWRPSPKETKRGLQKSGLGLFIIFENVMPFVLFCSHTLHDGWRENLETSS